VEKKNRICHLVCLLASQMMASWSCATVVPQECLAQPAVSTEREDAQAAPLANQDVDPDDAEAEGPDASDATEPVHEGVEPPEAAPEGHVSSAAALGRAFAALRQAKHDAAVRQFQAALDAQELNDAGRALVYWHIAAAEQAQGAPTRARDALSSFIVVASDLLAEDSRHPQAPDNSENFVRRFDLLHRVARARAELSVAWAMQTNSFGRSMTSPVPVHNAAEMRYFLELAPPCLPGHPRRAYQLGAVGAQLTPGMSQVQLSCDDSSTQAQYYFVDVAGH
jgi:hypothetical protein